MFLSLNGFLFIIFFCFFFEKKKLGERCKSLMAPQRLILKEIYNSCSQIFCSCVRILPFRYLSLSFSLQLQSHRFLLLRFSQLRRIVNSAFMETIGRGSYFPAYNGDEFPSEFVWFLRNGEKSKVKPKETINVVLIAPKPDAYKKLLQDLSSFRCSLGK